MHIYVDVLKGAYDPSFSHGLHIAYTDHVIVMSTNYSLCAKIQWFFIIDVSVDGTPMRSSWIRLWNRFSECTRGMPKFTSCILSTVQWYKFCFYRLIFTSLTNLFRYSELNLSQIICHSCKARNRLSTEILLWWSVRRTKRAVIIEHPIEWAWWMRSVCVQPPESSVDSSVAS